MESANYYIDIVATITQIIGVLIIFFGSVYALFNFFGQIKDKGKNAYGLLRLNVGKSILLGLEVLIAADIMATVVTEPTLQSVSVLGLIVIIRTFLSLSLQVELSGKFPWQKGSKKAKNKNV